MQLSELRNQVAYWLDDLNFTYFTQTQVNRWINQAQREVQKRLIHAGEQFYTVVASTSTVVNQQDYILPTDFLKLNRLELILSGTVPNEVAVKLEGITMNQKDLLMDNNSSTPSGYFFKKNRLVLCPIPDAVYTMKLWYTYKVVDLVQDTDIPDVPEQFHEFITLLAAKDGFIKDSRDPSNLNAKIEMYEKWLLRDAEERAEDAPRQVVVTTTDIGGAF